MWDNQRDWSESVVCQGKRNTRWGEQCTADRFTSHGMACSRYQQYLPVDLYIVIICKNHTVWLYIVYCATVDKCSHRCQWAMVWIWGRCDHCNVSVLWFVVGLWWHSWPVLWPQRAFQGRWWCSWHKLFVHGRLRWPRVLQCRDFSSAVGSKGNNAVFWLTVGATITDYCCGLMTEILIKLMPNW